jgi:hypothetical protein
VEREIVIPIKNGRPAWDSVTAYGLPHPPQGWSWRTEANATDTSVLKYGGHFLPRVGARVRVDMNKFGWGTVTGYFVVHGWLGVEVMVDRPPAWWVRQRKQSHKPIDVSVHFFGIDLGAVEPPIEYIGTSHCNFTHRLSDGKPVEHECSVLPPEALRLERTGDVSGAVAVIERAKPLRTVRGVRRT